MVKRHPSNLGGSTLVDTGQVGGCTMEDRTVRPERVAAYIVDVVQVAFGSVAAASVGVLGGQGGGGRVVLVLVCMTAVASTSTSQLS